MIEKCSTRSSHQSDDTIKLYYCFIDASSILVKDFTEDTKTAWQQTQADFGKEPKTLYILSDLR